MTYHAHVEFGRKRIVQLIFGCYFFLVWVYPVSVYKWEVNSFLKEVPAEDTTPLFTLPFPLRLSVE